MNTPHNENQPKSEQQACRVLAVDDDEGMRETLTAILRPTCDIVSVDSAEQALVQLERRAFDVVLSDIRLPGLNGIDLLQIVKERWPSTEVIMISVISEVSVAVEAMRLGAFFYTTKDFDYEPLNELVQLAVKGKWADEKNAALRRENLALRRENEQLRARLNVPTNIEDRRRRATDSPLSCRASLAMDFGRAKP